MSWISDNEGKITTAVIGGGLAGLSWLVRTIFTNHKRLGLLEQRTDLHHADLTRRLDEVKAGTVSAQQEIMTLLKDLKR